MLARINCRVQTVGGAALALVQSVRRVQEAVVARKLDAAALRVARAGGTRGEHVVVDLVGDGGDGEEHRGGGAAGPRRGASGAQVLKKNSCAKPDLEEIASQR